MLKIKFYSTWEPFSTDKGMNLMAQWDFPSLMFMIQSIKYDLISMIYDAYRRDMKSCKKKKINWLVGIDYLRASEIRESSRCHREKWNFLSFDSRLCHISTHCLSLFIGAMMRKFSVHYQTEVFHLQKVWVNYVHGCRGGDGSADWITGAHGVPFFIYSSNQTATLNMLMKTAGGSSQRPWKKCSSQNGPSQEPWREGAENQEHNWIEESMPHFPKWNRLDVFFWSMGGLRGCVMLKTLWDNHIAPTAQQNGLEVMPSHCWRLLGVIALLLRLRKLAHDGAKTLNWPPCSRTQSILNQPLITSLLIIQCWLIVWSSSCKSF